MGTNRNCIMFRGPCYLPFYGRVLAFLDLLEVENEWTKTCGVFLGYIFHWTIWFREISSEFVCHLCHQAKLQSQMLPWLWPLMTMGALFRFASFFGGKPRRNSFATRPTSKPTSPAIFGGVMRSSRPVPRCWKVLAVRPEQDLTKWLTRWWFQIFCIFTHIWGRFPFWLIFFEGVETTN